MKLKSAINWLLFLGGYGLLIVGLSCGISIARDWRRLTTGRFMALNTEYTECWDFRTIAETNYHLPDGRPVKFLVSFPCDPPIVTK